MRHAEDGPYKAIYEDLCAVMRRADNLGITVVIAMSEHFAPQREDSARDRASYLTSPSSSIYAAIGLSEWLHRTLLRGMDEVEE